MSRVAALATKRGKSVDWEHLGERKRREAARQRRQAIIDDLKIIK